MHASHTEIKKFVSFFKFFERFLIFTTDSLYVFSHGTYPPYLRSIQTLALGASLNGSSKGKGKEQEARDLRDQSRNADHGCASRRFLHKHVSFACNLPSYPSPLRHRSTPPPPHPHPPTLPPPQCLLASPAAASYLPAGDTRFLKMRFCECFAHYNLCSVAPQSFAIHP